MTALAALLPLAVVGVLAFLAVVLIVRGREGIDISARSLFRAYLYIASFAGVVALAFGLSSLLTALLAAVAGNELAYGGIPQEAAIRRGQELDVQRAQEALRGATFTVSGGLFWLVHWPARNRVDPGDQGALRHGYALLGTAVFALATIVLLPIGMYQALAFWLLPMPAGFRQGVGTSFAGGLVALAIWLLYLRLVLGDLPRGRGREWLFRGGAAPMLPEGSPVGARIGPPPSGRSVGAEAVPSRDAE